jgi:outer membrane receptor for ferrienterochelin and colicins
VKCFSVAAILLLAGSGFAADDNAGEGPRAGKPEAVLFDTLPVVEAASLHAQSLLEAPASVTIITDEDIRRRGYRTLAEALADVRGMYVSYDRAYYYVGLRGFSIPGDGNNRFLVMINGHSMTESVFGSANYFGQDFGLDLELVKRIEIVRGPSSALYGTNGMFATINIVTKSPVEYEAFRAVAETDNFGERRVHLSTSQYLGKGVNLLLSASAFNNVGQSLYFPEFDTPQTNHGKAADMDGERGYHTFANLIWRGWSFTAYLNSREKIVPTAWYGTVFNDSGTKTRDARGFVESAYERNIGEEGRLRWRTYYDRYRFVGRFEFAADAFQSGPDVADGRNVANGDWIGTELTYRFRLPRMGFLTVGSEATWELRTQMDSYYVTPLSHPFAPVDRNDRSMALFFQDEWALSRRWTLYLGGRVDDTRNHSLSLTPRIALIYQPSAASAVKLLYGRSFRDPSPFEQFYEDGISQIANPSLRPERMETFEVSFDRRLTRTWHLQTNVYQYRLSELIVAQPLGDLLQQYQNAVGSRSTGVELEATGKWKSGIQVIASMALQGSADGANAVLKVNSPARVGKLLVDLPLFRNALSASAALQYMSDRQTLAGDHVPAVYLVNLTVASRRLPGGLEIQAGVRNLLNYRYWDPAGIVQSVDKLQQDGRGFFVRLCWTPESRKDEGKGAGAVRSGFAEP